MKPKDKAQLKFKILNLLMAEIYKHVNERYDKEVREIASQNTALQEELVDPNGFYFRGDWVSVNIIAVAKPSVLHKSLEERAALLMDWWNPIELEERPLITGFIRKILNQSNDMAVVLPLLPGPLHGVIREATNAPAEMIGSLPAEEVARIVGASEKSWRAFNIRMMSNLIGA